jgi:hypothetical protein|uniref:Uncharacterized protein n=1 Tax=Zea mays TaxID=4577 RepID=A0A804QTR9_MAIZE
MRQRILENIVKYGLFLVNLVQNFHELSISLCCKNKKIWCYWCMQCAVAKERKLCSVNVIEREFAILLSVKPENHNITIGFVCFLCTQKRLVRAVERVLHYVYSDLLGVLCSLPWLKK